MLVYAVHLLLDASRDRDGLFRAVAEWVGKKVNQNIPYRPLLSTTSRRFSDALGSRLETWVATDGTRREHAIRFTHGDAAVSGRLWIVEVGARYEQGTHLYECTVLLETSEISTKVQQPVTLSPPRVIDLIIGKNTPTLPSAGTRLLDLTPGNASDVQLYELLDAERKHSIILVSPTAAGVYLVNPQQLLRLVVGLADVRVISQDADTRAISKALGAVPAPYNGAVTVVFPRWRSRGGAESLPTTLLTPDDLAAPESGSAEIEVLGRLLHRTNLPTSWRHISPDRVREAHRRYELERLRVALAEMGPQSQAFQSLVAEAVVQADELKQRISDLEAERDSYWLRAEETEDELKQIKYQKDQLDLSLRASRMSRSDRELTINDDLRALIFQSVTTQPTVEQGLKLIAELFPDRVIVLDTAAKAAAHHQAFRYGPEALELMYSLVTRYWERLAAGEGDGVARRVFPSRNFAAKESHTLSKEGRRARTFQLEDGREIFMEAHLKIQRGPNPAESWRLHFEWLAEEKHIVIGHCGEHLPE